MKTLIKILCLSVLWFSCESSTEPQETEIIPETTDICENQFNSEILICDDVCELYGEECYHSYDLNVLTDIRDNNESVLAELLTDIGDQYWENGRLRNLNISNLELTYIPPTLCNIECDINVSNNQLCQQYEFDCIDTYGEQNHPSMDECGICNGDGTDEDEDGICDDIDDCIGEYDICDVCNGNGIDTDNDGICDDTDDCPYDIDNDIDNDGICGDLDNCPNDPYNLDEDQDGICDDIDFCFGEYDNGYYCSDLDVLYDFIIQNPHLTTNVWELGSHSWHNGRLRYLALSSLGLTAVPSSIGTLDSLETLFLNNNELSSLPNTLCDLPSNCEIYIYNNNLCEEYQYECIDWGWHGSHWEPQDCQE